MSDILLYFFHLFLNTSFIILYFFILQQMVCSITILFLEWLLLYSFSSGDNSCGFLFFLYALLHDPPLPNAFSYPLPTKHVKWSVYNQSLVRRGEIILGFDVINNWDTELKEMNKDKVGL